MVGTLLSGGSLILRGVAGTLRPGSARLRPSGSFLASSGAEPVSGRPRLGGGGGSKGLGLLEVKEWARGKSEKAGFRGTGTGGGGYAGGCVRVSAELKNKLASHRGWTTTTLYYNRQQEPIMSAPLMALPAAGQQQLIQYGSFIVSLLPYLMANI